MINFSDMIRRFEKLDGFHFLTIRRMIDNVEQSVTAVPIRCWIDLKSADKPDAGVIQAQPIIKTLDIYAFPWVDIRNGDFLVVQKTTRAGLPNGSWCGQCGEPFMYEPYQIINMRMAKVGGGAFELPLPPLPNESSVYVHFFNEERFHIHDTAIYRAPIGKLFDIPLLELDGFTLSHATLNGKKLNALTGVSFTPVESFYNVELIYLRA